MVRFQTSSIDLGDGSPSSSGGGSDGATAGDDSGNAGGDSGNATGDDGGSSTFDSATQALVPKGTFTFIDPSATRSKR